MLDNPDLWSVVARAISFVLLLNAAGVGIFIAVFGRLVPHSLPAVYRLGGGIAVAALIFVALHQALEAARMAGELSGAMDPAMQKMAILSSTGAAFAMRMAGLAILVVGMWRGARWPEIAGATRASAGRAGALATTAGIQTVSPDAFGSPAVVIGVLLATTSFALTGHTSVNPHRAASAVLLMLHLLVVAFWLGALIPLFIAAGREQPQVAARLIEAFSRIAGWVVPGILVAGVGLTALLVPALSVFTQPYGQLLMTKIGLFAVLMGLAAFNKWVFGPVIAQAARAFRYTVAAEYVLICAVLAVTAAMTTFYSPEAP